MAASTVNIQGKYRPSGGQNLRSFSQAAEDIPYGAMVMINAAGFAANATDTTGTFFLGICVQESDNSAGSAGDVRCLVDVGGAEVLVTHEDGSLTIADVGAGVVQELNNEVTSAGTGTNDIVVGTITEVPSGTTCWVKCKPYGVVA